MGQKISEMTDVAAGALATDQMELARSSSSSSFRISLTNLATFIKAFVAPLVGTTLTITGAATFSAGLTVSAGTLAAQALTATTVTASTSLRLSTDAARIVASGVTDALTLGGGFNTLAITPATTFAAAVTTNGSVDITGTGNVLTLRKANNQPGMLLVGSGGNNFSIGFSAASTLSILKNDGVTAILSLTQAGLVTASAGLTVTTGDITASAGILIAKGAAGNVGAGAVGYGGTTQTTVGAAGGASALPATPVGYIIVNVAGTNRTIPFYNT